MTTQNLQTLTELSRFWSKQPRGYTFLAYFDSPDKDDRKLVTQIVGPGKTPVLPNDADVYDLYFTPHVFTGKRRVKDLAGHGQWCYADLDEVDPKSITPTPTMSWMTSPGRYQCAWYISDGVVSPQKLESLNQALTYHTGADKGGWSLTKLLRVPGSYHYKNEKVRGKWLMRNGPSYTYQELMGVVGSSIDSSTSSGTSSSGVSSESAKTLFMRHRAKIPAATRSLMTKKSPSGDRSAVIFRIECSLAEAGIPADEIVTMVRATCWNKYKGQRRELKMLTQEVGRAVARVKSRENTDTLEDVDDELPTPELVDDDAPDRVSKLVVTDFKDLMTAKASDPTWMIRGMWSAGAVGLIAGEPKSYKSLMTLDMAVSVASGTKFLNTLEVPKRGPVLVIQEELDTATIKKWVMNIASGRDLFHEPDQYKSEDGTIHLPSWEDLPLHFVNQRGIDITDDETREDLDALIGQIKPALLVLDPFYMLTSGVDENSTSEVAPVLKWITNLKRKHGVGVMLTHHYRKANKEKSNSGEQRIAGASAFGRWFESAVFVERMEELNTIRLVPSHRAHQSQAPTIVTVDMAGEDDASPYYNPVLRQQTVDPTADPTGAVADSLEALMDRHPFIDWEKIRKIAPFRGVAKQDMDDIIAQRSWTFHKLPRDRKTGGGGKTILCPINLSMELRTFDDLHKAMDYLAKQKLAFKRL